MARVYRTNNQSVEFRDPREFWDSLSKHEVTKEFEDETCVSGSTALAVAVIGFKKDVAYGPMVETKWKTLGGDPQVDGVFDLQVPSGRSQVPSGRSQVPSGRNQVPSGRNQVKNATYARLTTEEKSDTFTPIEFVKKNGVFVLEGCDRDHPLFLPHTNAFCRAEKFKIETDGETIQYRQFVMEPKKLKQFFAKVVLHSFPSIFANERVVLASLGSNSYTFQLNESQDC
jgi:hypothetical protein